MLLVFIKERERDDLFILGFYSYLGFAFQSALALGLLFTTHKNSTMPIRSHLCKER